MYEPTDWYAKIPKHLLKKVQNPGFKLHGIKVPFRMIVLAPTGGGKSTFLMQLIHDMTRTFNHIHIACMVKDELLYNKLESDISKCTSEGDDDVLTFSEESIPPMDELKAMAEGEQQLVVFDDMIGNKRLQPTILDYYKRGRKMNMSMVYLAQVFFDDKVGVPKGIRNQVGYIVIKGIERDDLRLIIRRFNLSKYLDYIVHIYETCVVPKPLYWMMLDVHNPDINKRVRVNYTPVQLVE